MPNFCLLPSESSRFYEALQKGEIKPEELGKMTSEERHDFFSGIVGADNAKGVNGLFESKMLLKNQKFAYTNWAKQVAGLKPEVRRDLIAKIERIQHVLDPEEESAFLKDLASTRLGLDVTYDEAKTIAGLSKRVQETRDLPRSSLEEAHKRGWQPTENDLAYGRARYDLNDYTNNLSHEASKFRFSDLKGKDAPEVAKHLTQAVFDLSKSIGASLDDSFALRQGLKMFWTDNKLWRKEFLQSFQNIAKGFKNPAEANREFESHLMADPYYEKAVKDKLRIRGNEDAFPTSTPEKIPVFGRPFSASEVAYKAFAQNLRLAKYKDFMRKAEGMDAPQDYGKNMAALTNSMTGAGGFGRMEPMSGYLNVAFYSLRFLKSNLDTLVRHPLYGGGVGGVGSEGQKEAVKNLAKIIAGTGAVMATANALKPGSVETDPRSSDFGKIKIGNTRFDVSGGMASIITLLAREATHSTKSSTTGVITDLNSGKFGSQTQKDVLTTFFENKASPVGGVILDVLNGKTHSGEKPTLKGELASLVTPLMVKNAQELHNDPNSANDLVGVLADFFGISTNTYGKSTTDWGQSTSKELSQLKTKLGPDEFQKANDEFNKNYDNWFSKTSTSDRYKNLPDDEKQALMTGEKARIKADIFKQYDFKPAKAKGTTKDLLNSFQ